MAASTINTECKRYGCMKNLLACFANCRYTARCDELRNELADKTAQAEGDINRYLSERGRKPVLVQLLKRGVKFDDQAARAARRAAPLAAAAPATAKSRLKPQIKARRTAAPKPAVAAVELPALSPKAAPPVVKARRLATPVKVRSITKSRAAGRPTPVARDPKIAPPSVISPVTAGMAAPRAALRLAAVTPRRPGSGRSRKRSKMPRRAKPEVQAKATSPASPLQDVAAIAPRPETTSRQASERATPRKKATKSRKAAGNGKVYIIIEGQTASIVDEQGLMVHLFGNHSKTARYFEASEVEARVQIVLKR
jgi:hypothetical protein